MADVRCQQENLVLRINHDKFLVVFRNAELVSLAEQRLGKVTAQVYAEFLNRIEPKIFRCKDNVGEELENDDKPAKSTLLAHYSYVFQELTHVTEIKLSCLELAKNFNKNINLEGSIALPHKESKSNARKRSLDDSDDDEPYRNSISKPNGKSRHGSDESEEESEGEEVDEWAEEDEDMEPEAIEERKRMKILKQHLLLLMEDSLRFLTSEGNRGMGEWSVNYKELGKTMRSIELEKIVEERFESTGTRLLRIIKDKGKLDEKQVNSLFTLFMACLLTSTDCEHCVT